MILVEREMLIKREMEGKREKPVFLYYLILRSILFDRVVCKIKKRDVGCIVKDLFEKRFLVMLFKFCGNTCR